MVPFDNARTPRGLKLRRSIGLTLQCNTYFKTAIPTYSLVLACLHVAFSFSREIHLIALDIDFQRAKFQDRILFSPLSPSRTSQSLRFASRDRHLDDMRRKIFQKSRQRVFSPSTLSPYCPLSKFVSVPHAPIVQGTVQTHT